MTDVICPTCGARNTSAGGFCGSCGTYLEWVNEPETTPPPQIPDIGRQASTEPSPRPTRPAGPAPSPADGRPRDDRRARRSGLLAHRPLTANVVPGHTLAPGPGAGDPAQAWLTPPDAPANPLRTGGMCPRCGAVNAPGKRYCRCGTRLRPFEPPPTQPPPPTPAESGPRGFRAAMRAAGKGRHPRFDRPVSGRTRAVRGVAVAVVLVLALLPLTPPGASAIGRLSDSAMSLVPYGYAEVETSGAAVDPPESAVPHYSGDYAVDRTGPRAWAVAWTEPPLPQRCGASTAPALIVGFAHPTGVSRVIVNAGLDPADTNRTKQLEPKTVDITFPDGDCERLELTGGPADQEFRVSSGTVGQARVQIVAVTPAKGQAKNGDSQSPALTALSEIRFYSG